MSFGEMKNTGLSKYTGYSYEGKPITLTKKPGPPIKQERHNARWFPEETKIEAATMYAATRNLKTVQEYTKVPVSTLRRWQSEPWWTNVVDRVVKDNNDQLDAALTDIIDTCKDQIQDRLKNGDVRVNFKTGETYTTPMSARELTMTLAILFDKRQLIRGEATSRSETVSQDKRLEVLREQFVKFSEASEIEGEFEDATTLEEDPQAGEGQSTPEAVLLVEDQRAGAGAGNDCAPLEHTDSFTSDESQAHP
jgi:hypothetical protein